MKKLSGLFVLIFIIAVSAFAEGTAEERAENLKNSPVTQAIQKDMINKKFDILANGYSDDRLYVLAKDANWTLYLYQAWVGSTGKMDGGIKLYQEDGKATKESIKKEVDKGNNVSKIIDESYIAFKIAGFPDKFYIKTPKGDFYSVSKRIREAQDAASFTGIDDFLN